MVWLFLAMPLVAVASRAARATTPNGASSGRPLPCLTESERRRGWDLRGPRPPCTPQVAPPGEASVPFSLFSPPWKGVALKWGMLASVGSEHRYGIGIEPGLSYYGRAIELGLSLRIQGLWSEDWGLFQSNERRYRDVLIVPRVNLSAAADHEGFWRMHASAGFGPTYLRARDGAQGSSDTDHTVWSYTGSAGVSAGAFFLALEVLGYMASVETGPYFVDEFGITPSKRDSPGWMLSLGLMVPIAISGGERPPAAPSDERSLAPGRCRRRGQKINALPLC